MNNHLTLPALDGRNALGFLAACGTFRLLSEHADIDVRLSWDPRTAQARLHGVETIGDIVATLVGVVDSINEESLLPNGPAGFPGDSSPEGWERGDPMRMPVGIFRQQVAEWITEYGDEFVNTWVPAMVTDLMEDDKHAVEITRFAAPSGQQKFFTMLDKNLAAVRKDPELLQEALEGWRRRDGVSGEYLDHHVLRSAADTTSGKSDETGVPGATWLALMALPWFPAYATTNRRLTTGWQFQRKARRALFVWPLWAEPLAVAPVRAMLTHPSLALHDHVEAEVSRAKLEPLSVFLVCAAGRRAVPGRNFAGVLAPVPVEMA